MSECMYKYLYLHPLPAAEYLRMGLEETSDSHGVLLVLFHANVEGLHAPHGEEAVERRRNPAHACKSGDLECGSGSGRGGRERERVGVEVVVRAGVEVGGGLGVWVWVWE